MPRFRAVLFDLDGTLVGVDMDTFLPAYMERLAAWLADVVDPERFRRWLLQATGAMLANRPGGPTNEQVFWVAFERLSGVPRPAIDARVEAFYAQEFPRLRALAEPLPGAVEAVEAAFAHAERVAIATNPVFPEAAIRERLRWAGLDQYPFHLVTSYERMHACKPAPAYFEEVLRHLGVAPAEALMVGNDPEADLPAARLGIRTYLVEAGRRYGSGLEAAAALGGVEPAPPAPVPDRRGDLRELARWLSLRP